MRKPDVPCPVCGAEPAYRVWGRETGHIVPLNPLKKRAMRDCGIIIPLVCTVCGYIQFFTRPEYFRD